MSAITEIGPQCKSALLTPYTLLGRGLKKALATFTCAGNRPHDIVAATPVVSKPFGFEHVNAGQSGARAFQPGSHISVHAPSPKPKRYSLYSAKVNSDFATGTRGVPSSDFRSSTAAATQPVSKRPMPRPRPLYSSLHVDPANARAPSNVDRVFRSDSSCSDRPPDWVPPPPPSDPEIEMVTEAFSFLEPLPGSVVLRCDDIPVSYA